MVVKRTCRQSPLPQTPHGALARSNTEYPRAPADNFPMMLAPPSLAPPTRACSAGASWSASMAMAAVTRDRSAAACATPLVAVALIRSSVCRIA
eukprot:6895177-Pyramimonas_sp.AAC.1